MQKLDLTGPELVWPGKYDEDGRLTVPPRFNLPFQIIERVNETRATRNRREERLAGHVGTLFDFWQVEDAQNQPEEDDWRNKLIWGDNLYVMSSLLEHFAGKINLIYIDPPFATGADFSIDVEVGGEEDSVETATKQQSIIEEKAYRDTWGRGISSYLGIMYERLWLMKELLHESGSILVHVDYRVNSHLRLLLDEIFGSESYQNEIAWCYGGGGAPKSFYPRKHDTIMWYTKGDTWTFNKQYRPYSESTKRTGFRSKGMEGYELNPEGAGLTDWWSDCPKILSYNAAENWKYPTQKPESLIERIIEGHSNERDIVADFFGGSGTTFAMAEQLNRRWIGCDLSRYAIHTTRKRLMEIPNARPFEILNLGRYERQVWQGVTFGKSKQSQKLLVFEYLKFILELYGAEPLAGTQFLHGKKGDATVHVGAVDAPVTINEVSECLIECRTMGQKELHVLGWEWEMGLANMMVDEAKAQGIKLLLMTIPREVMEERAVAKRDVHFYELAYMETGIDVNDLSVAVSLTDFVIPNDELISEEVRGKITTWSDYIDYWAVDWNFQNDTFINGWTSYRTPKKRELELTSAPHTYEVPGTYNILVKAIDIFGNDTSQRFRVEVLG